MAMNGPTRAVPRAAAPPPPTSSHPTGSACDQRAREGRGEAMAASVRRVSSGGAHASCAAWYESRRREQLTVRENGTAALRCSD